MTSSNVQACCFWDGPYEWASKSIRPEPYAGRMSALLADNIIGDVNHCIVSKNGGYKLISTFENSSDYAMIRRVVPLNALFTVCVLVMLQRLTDLATAAKENCSIYMVTSRCKCDIYFLGWSIRVSIVMLRVCAFHDTMA